MPLRLIMRAQGMSVVSGLWSQQPVVACVQFDLGMLTLVQHSSAAASNPVPCLHPPSPSQNMHIAISTIIKTAS